MAFDNNVIFDFSNGAIQTWEKPLGITTAYFLAYGGGGGGSEFASGGGGAYIFSNFPTLHPNKFYDVAICVGSGGESSISAAQLGGRSVGGRTNSFGGDGSVLDNFRSAGGGGMTCLYYNETANEQTIKIIAGGGGGAGCNPGTNGGASGFQPIQIAGKYSSPGVNGSGLGGGQRGNRLYDGNGGLGSLGGGVNGYNYLVDTSGTTIFYNGGGGGSGGTYAGGGGGAGFGGGAGGKGGGGGGGGSYSNATSYAIFKLGEGGAGGGINQAGSPGRVIIYWNDPDINTNPPIVAEYMLNARHSCISPYVAPHNPPGETKILNLAFTTGNKNTPYQAVISAYKTLYVVTGDGVLNAVNPDFTFKWQYSLLNNGNILDNNKTLTQTPVIGVTNTLYISATSTDLSYNFYALTDTGVKANISWRFPLDGNATISPAIDFEGRLYVGTDKGSLYKIKDGNSAGVQQWVYSDPSGAVITGTPVFNDSYTRLSYTTATAINVITLPVFPAVPSLVWSQPIINANTPSVDASNIAIYVSTKDGEVHTYRISDGSSKWAPITISDGYLSAVAVGKDNYIYVTSAAAFNVIDASGGTLQWTFPFTPVLPGVPVLGPDYHSIPIIDASNIVYFGAYNYIYAIDGVRRLFKWRALVGGNVYSMPIIGNNSNLYASANDGKMYDFSGNAAILPAPIVPMYMINAEHKGVSPYYGPTTEAPPTIEWSESYVSNNLFVSPTISISYDNMLYLGSGNANLYALDALTGTKDTFQLPIIHDNSYICSPGAIYTTPLIGLDDVIYIGTNEGYLYALNKTLNPIKWSYLVGGPLQSSPIMDTDGAIYFGAGNLLYAIGDGGEYGMYTRWSTPFVAGGYIIASPAVSTLTGLVYFGADDGKVYAVDSLTGLQKWSITPPLTPTLTPPTPSPVILGIHPIYTAATIDVSGNVIIGNGSYMQGILYYLNGTTGTVLWSNAFQDVTGPFYNAVAVKDDRIYFSTIAYVYAVERTTGIKQWQYNGTFVYFTAPIVDLSGTIFVCGINTNEDNNAQLKYQSNLISLTDNLDTTFNLNWSKQITTQVGRLAPPVIGLNQTLYISGTDNYIYAVK